MKKLLLSAPLTLVITGMVNGQGLYDIAPNDDALESSPITWSAGLSYNFDDNVTPTAAAGSSGFEDEVSSISAYVGASLVSITPQTTWDVFARLGGNLYLDSPEQAK